MLASRLIPVGEAAQSTSTQAYPPLQVNQTQRVYHVDRLPDAYPSMEQTNPEPHQTTPTQESHYGTGDAFQPSYMRIIRDSRNGDVEHGAPYRLPGAPSRESREHIAPCGMVRNLHRRGRLFGVFRKLTHLTQ